MIKLDIEVEAGGWDDVPGLQPLLHRAADAALSAVLAAERPDDGSGATVLLADDDAVRVLNREWRGQDKPTNVLSFPAPASPAGASTRHLGDLALAWETVRREAERESKRVADHAAHLVVHGLLHLLGYDHESDPEAEAMEAVEVAALARLGIADPYRAAA